jgi:4-hydroxymandelate oxidase
VESLAPTSLAELEAAAKDKLSAIAWDYYAGGADDEITLRANVAAYRRLALHYRVLVDVAVRDLATSVLGDAVDLPVLIAPTAFHRLAHPDGELAAVRAAGAAGTVFVLSTLSNTAVEAVVAAATGPVWFQLYVYRDRGATEALIRRVEAAGCKKLVLTVDAPLIGRRERDVRNRFTLPEGLRLENLHAGFDTLPAAAEDSGLSSYVAQLLDAGLAWDDLAWLREVTTLPIVVKGIVRPDDATRAVAAGAAGIIVSNHGGRQLDGAPATIDVLPAIVDAVGGAIEVLLDGGIRRGTDVIKALALGARGVLIGRPVLWGLATAGEAGVRQALEILRREIDLGMALCGCPTIATITRDLVRPAPFDPV